MLITYFLLITKIISLTIINILYFFNVLVDTFNFLLEKKNKSLNDNEILNKSLELLNNWTSYAGIIILTNFINMCNIIDFYPYIMICEFAKITIYYNYLINDDFDKNVFNNMLKLFHINKWSILKLQLVCNHTKNIIKKSIK
jgi:hypothetical protein